MNAPSEKFVDKAMAAIDALRVFAHNVQLDEASFKSAAFSAGKSYREVIEYRSTQCWGEVSRTKTTVTIKVTPHIRSEEHTSELQSLMRISYAVFCLKKKLNLNNKTNPDIR